MTGAAPAKESTRWRLGHRPSLDALRGLAVLSVLLGHFGLPLWGAGGTVGVALFFALSGYLITGILLEGINFRRFYIRRARRLLPALAVLVIAIGLWSVLMGRVATFVGDALPVVFYVANWSWLDGQKLTGLAHAWSLSVEEQFYLVWPVTLWFLLRRGLRVTIAGTAVLIAISFIATILAIPELRAFAGSDARAKDLLMGCMVALLSARAGRDVAPSTAVVVLAVAILGVIGFAAQTWIDPLLTGVPCALVVAWVAARPRLGAWRPLTFTGRISYGLYLYHYPFAYGAWPLFDELRFSARFVALFVVSYATAIASWFLVERRFLSGVTPERSAVPRGASGAAASQLPASEPTA